MTFTHAGCEVKAGDSVRTDARRRHTADAVIAVDETACPRTRPYATTPREFVQRILGGGEK
jgi:hypothetical protein